MRIFRSFVLLSSFALVGACGPAPTPVPITNVPDTPPPPTATAAPAARVDTVRVAWADTPPSGLVIDGDDSEWGLVGVPPSVTLHVSKQGAAMVASLRGHQATGVWIELSVPAPTLPTLGEWQRDGTFIEFNCSPELAPPEAARCKETLDNHAAFVEEQNSRFSRLYRLDAQEVRWKGKNGMEPVPNAVTASELKSDRLTIEVILPLSALPRMSEAPASSFFLFASSAPESAAPSIKPDERHELTAPADIHFEPMGALRAAARAKVIRGGFSYHPAEPNVIEIVDFPDRIHGGTSLEPRDKVLWQPVTKMGDLEVGYVQLADVHLGIFKASKLLDIVDLEGEPMGFVERGGALHFFSYMTAPLDPIGATSAHWNVTAVDSAGKTSNPFVDDSLTSGWDSVDEFYTAKFDRFGMRGRPHHEQGQEGPSLLEITWKPDKKSGKYVPSQRELTSLPKDLKKP